MFIDKYKFWKIISFIEAVIICFLVVTTVNALGTFPTGCIAGGLDGRYLCWRDNVEQVKFDLTHWKLQIPGPKDIIPIGSYTSKYFYYGSSNEMVFWVDSSETGTTANSSYVRSELREMLDPTNSKINWLIPGTHTLKAELEVTKAGAPKITVLQIHGIEKDGTNAPPLLKMTVENGSLYALLKVNNSGSSEDKHLLATGVKKFLAEIEVKDSRLVIKIDGKIKLDKSISFWKHYNYFKAGLYPQATKGISEVKFYQLEIKHIP